MSYKIEKAGYEYRGWKLGQKVMYDGEETIIIGFDTTDNEAFIAVKYGGSAGFNLRGSVYVKIILDTAYTESHKTIWVKASDITPIKTKKESPKMEKKMTKAELEGKWVRCTWKRNTNHYKVGDLLEIKNKLIVSLDKGDKLFSWYENLKEEFTIAELNKVLETSYDTTVKFEYVGDYPQSPNKVKSDGTKPDKKSKLSEVKVKVDMLFDPPVIEETDDEVFIFSGRSTIYISKEFGIYGIATVNSKELSSYDRETGKAISYYRAFKSMDKK